MIERWDGNNTDDIFSQLVQGMDLDTTAILEDDKKNALIKRARNAEPLSFDRFQNGDTLILTLVGEQTVIGAPLPYRLLVGKIADRQMGLIDVADVVLGGTDDEEIKKLIDKRIGLAYSIEISADKTTRAAVLRRIAGNQEAAYYLADDMADIGFGDRAPSEDKIKYTQLKFGKATVAGTVLFDFITPDNRL